MVFAPAVAFADSAGDQYSESAPAAAGKTTPGGSHPASGSIGGATAAGGESSDDGSSAAWLVGALVLLGAASCSALWLRMRRAGPTPGA